MYSCPSCEGFIAKIKEGRGDHIKSGQRLPRLQHFPSSCKKLIWSNMAHIKHLQHLPPKRTVSIKEHWPMHFRTSYESAKLPTAQQKVFKVKKTVFTVHTRNQLGVFDFCQDLNSHQWVGNAWKEPKITRKLTQITQIADPYHICWWL